MNVDVIIHTDLNALINQANAAKFEEYSDCGIFGLYRSLTLTCLDGKHNGEVIEINYTDRGVFKIDIYCQFKGQQPTFKFIN